jgi:hypothetical protein
MELNQSACAEARSLVERTSNAFADYPVPPEAHFKIEMDRFDDDGSVDEDFALVRSLLLGVLRWQELLQVPLPSDGTLIPCLCPGIWFLAMLPLFMVVTLRDIFLGDQDRMFLDSFVRRLIGDPTIGCATVREHINSIQSTTLASYLRFISAECYRSDDTSEISGIANLVKLLEAE